MQDSISGEIILGFKERLQEHPIYQAVVSIEDLRCFMQHHVYSVWDFMSLIKYLQSVVAPTSIPWIPHGDASVRRFINELVLEEESDETQIPGQFSSHFELYQQAMTEIGADTTASSAFVNCAAQQGIVRALAESHVPEPAKQFTTRSFDFISSDKPHVVAAALALGREHIIPCMFRSILKRIGVTPLQAPMFHFYLNRHIHLDEDFHAPLSLRLLNNLCGGDDDKIHEAIEAANQAVTARLEFWDGVLTAIKSHSGN